MASFQPHPRLNPKTTGLKATGTNRKRMKPATQTVRWQKQRFGVSSRNVDNADIIITTRPAQTGGVTTQRKTSDFAVRMGKVSIPQKTCSLMDGSASFACKSYPLHTLPNILTTS